MTVHAIDTSFQYPAPDMSKIQKSRAELNYKIRTLSSFYLPILAEELKDLQIEIDNTDSKALSALTLVPATLQTSEINQYYSIIQTLQTGDPTEEQKEALLSYYAEIRSLIDNSLSSTLKYATELNNGLTNLKSVALSDNQYRIKELEQTIETISSQLPDEKKAIELLVKDETALNEAIKILESTDIFILIKDLLLSVDALAGLNLSAPQVELVKAGIATTGKLLGLASDAIKYDKLITARKQVQTRLDDRRNNLGRINKSIKESQERKDQLMEAQTVGAPRDIYTQEISTLADALNKFLEINTYGASDEWGPIVKTFIEQSKIFSKLLDSLRQEWRS